MHNHALYVTVPLTSLTHPAEENSIDNGHTGNKEVQELLHASHLG